MPPQKILQEIVPCPLCQSREHTPLFFKQSFHIVSCSRCGLVYVNPRLTKQSLLSSYNANAFSPKQYYLSTEKSDRKAFLHRWSLIRRYLPKTGKVLDVGCNVGTFLSVLKTFGWDCHGVDINRSVRKICESKGIAFSSRLHYPPAFFDLILLNDVLEHVPDPRSLIKKIYSFLKPGGLLFLVTPNVKSIPAKIFKSKWYHLKPKEHIIYFSPRTLHHLLSLFQLKILYQKHLGRHRTLNILFEKGSKEFSFLQKISRFIPNSLRDIVIPFSTFDELCIIARKQP